MEVIVTIEFTDELKAKVRARLAQPLNLGKFVWAERDECGNWLVHANLMSEAHRRMGQANEAGRVYFTAAEVLK